MSPKLYCYFSLFVSFISGEKYLIDIDDCDVEEHFSLPYFSSQVARRVRRVLGVTWSQSAGRPPGPAGETAGAPSSRP